MPLCRSVIAPALSGRRAAGSAANPAKLSSSKPFSITAIRSAAAGYRRRYSRAAPGVVKTLRRARATVRSSIVLKLFQVTGSAG